MRVVPLALLVLLVMLAGCTSGADVDTAASSPAETTAGEATPPSPGEDATAAATQPPDDTSASPQPSGTAGPDLSGLDQVVEELGLSPQTVLSVSFAACGSLAEGLGRGQVEQRLRDQEAELGLQELSGDQLADVIDAGVEAICPDQA